VNEYPHADKLRALEDELRRLERVVVAFSGGADSAFLAAVANRVLGDHALAVTAVSASLAGDEEADCRALATDWGLSWQPVATDEMANAAYRINDIDRCYHCKSELFGVLLRLRDELGFGAVAYGVNTDDLGDFRPGHRAASEAGVLSPFLDVALSKTEIRALSRAAGLPTADLPASACLSSRLPYGTEVTETRLRQVERGEDLLRALGFRQVRLRHHGELARVEVDPGELSFALEPAIAQAIVAALKPLGFRWVCLDLEGYRTGSLNEVLPPPVRHER
jgi:uncharacterized protein